MARAWSGFLPQNESIKRQWGFYHILTKRGIKRASADVGLMFIAYNLRRIMNILDKNMLKAYLEKLILFFTIKRTFIDLYSLDLRLQENLQTFRMSFKLAA